MWLAEKWKDYELIDCSNGEKLERWGEHILVRPDPQAIWETPRRHPGWRSPDARYVRSREGGGQWEKNRIPESWKIRYGELTFQVKPMNFKHTGLFPEQAVNWDWFGGLIRKRKEKDPEKPVKVLNLFAYTGGATLAAAAAGAEVVHVDASKGMVQWAKENAAVSGLENAPIRFFVDDCVKLVERELRRGNRYDGIIMDPPSYGRGPKGEIWKIEESLYPFVKQAAKLLSDDPLFFLLNSYTTGLAPSVLTYMIKLEIESKHAGATEASEIGLPVRDSRLVLPCGASGRFTGKI